MWFAVAWPPTTVCVTLQFLQFLVVSAWPMPQSADEPQFNCMTSIKIFQNRLKRPKDTLFTSADGRVTSDHCLVTVQQLFSFPNCLKRLKNVVWQSADGRVTSDHSSTASHIVYLTCRYIAHPSFCISYILCQIAATLHIILYQLVSEASFLMNLFQSMKVPMKNGCTNCQLITIT